MKKVFSYTIFWLTILAILVYFIDSTSIISKLAKENRKLKYMLEVSIDGYNDLVEVNKELSNLNDEVNEYSSELEDYIEYLYCATNNNVGGGTWEYKYLKERRLFSSNVTLFMINGEEVKRPPMEVVDCR